MSEENISQVDDKCCLDDANPMEISVETMHVIEEELLQGDDVLLPAAEMNHVNVRRYTTGALDKQPGKPQVQTRYRGNQTSSTHDLCKHGKRREEDLVIKPWKLVKKKNVQSGDLGKGETLRKSLGNVSKPDKSSLQAAKREAASEVVKSCDGLRIKKSETKSTSPSASAVVRTLKKTNLDVKKVSRISESKNSKEDLLKNLKNKEKPKIDAPARCDDSLEKTNLDVEKVSRISDSKNSKEDRLKNPKNKEKTKIDEPVRCEDALEKTNLDVKKVSRISKNKSSKEEILKNKEKMKIAEPVRCEDALEKTLYVVESSEEKKIKKKSIKSVKSEIQQSSEKKILRISGKKSLSLLPSLSPSSEVVKESRVTRSDPRPIRQTTSKSKTGLSEKKEIGSANLVTSLKTESKIIRPKRIGLKITPPPPPTKQLTSFKKGKVLEPKPEDSTPAMIKFKKRVVQEPKLRSEVNKKKKKNPKDKREGVGKVNGEGKREKVVLRHRKVEVKKKLQTLFNNVIEETVNKLEEVRKSKVKALVGAFETVISLQDNDRTSQKKKIQSKSITSQAVEG